MSERSATDLDVEEVSIATTHKCFVGCFDALQNI